MAIRIYPENGIIRLDFSGRVTKQDLVEGLAEIEDLEIRGSIVPHRIADMTAVTEFDNRFPEIYALAIKRKQRRFPNTFKSAIVAPRPAELGVARMFQILNDHPQMKIEIFQDFASAQKWINEPDRNASE